MIELTPKEAHEFLARHPRSAFVDCRGEWERMFTGYPAGSVSIPWIDLAEGEINPRFAETVRAEAGDNPVVLICRSGNRSLDAGHALEATGFKSVYHVSTGFEGDLDEHRHRNTKNGWRFDGLPWEQS
jgi:rhodanese-related sulfurtransferase